MKKVFGYIVNAISTLIIVASVGILLSVVMTRSGEAPNILGYSAFRVMTGSMEPAIPVDAMIVVHRCDPSAVKPGDVITFYSSDPSLGGAVNTHRVVEIEANGSDIDFVTKGDANLIQDEYRAEGENLVGVVVFSSHFLGILIRLLSNPLVFLPVLFIPLIFLLVWNLRKTILLTRQAMKEEEEKAFQEALELARKKRDEERAAAEENKDHTPEE